MAAGSGTSIAVLGAGSWGTALSMQLARAGARPVLWDLDTEHLQAIGAAGRNERFLPDYPLPSALTVEPDLESALRRTEEILIVVPSHGFVGLIEQIEPWLEPGQGIAWACKGLEPGTGQFLHRPAQRMLGNERPLAVVTGPSFAVEVAADLPTALTVAGTDAAFSARIARLLHAGNFRAYTSDDIVGAELGGSVKNVLAIATGMCDGMGLGDNARAALVTRGLAEMMRLGRELGEGRVVLDLAGGHVGGCGRRGRGGALLGEAVHVLGGHAAGRRSSTDSTCVRSPPSWSCLARTLPRTTGFTASRWLGLAVRLTWMGAPSWVT